MKKLGKPINTAALLARPLRLIGKATMYTGMVMVAALLAYLLYVQKVTGDAEELFWPILSALTFTIVALGMCIWSERRHRAGGRR